MQKDTGKSKKSGKSHGSSVVRPAIRTEVKLMGVIAVGLLLLIAVFLPDMGGVVGRFFHGLLLGLFGFGGFVLPVALIAVSVVMLIDKEIRLPVIRCTIIAWLVLALLHILVVPLNEYSLGAMEFLSDVYSSRRTFGGGVLGALLGNLIRFAIGQAGAIIGILVAILILLVLVTGRSFVNLLGRGVNSARNIYEENAAHHFDEYDEDDYEEENFESKKKPAKTKRVKTPVPVAAMPQDGGLKPLPKRLRRELEQIHQKAELLEVETYEYDDEEYTVLLIDEEMADLTKKDLPPFMTASKRRVTEPKILAFGEEVPPSGGRMEEPEYTHEFTYDDEPVAWVDPTQPVTDEIRIKTSHEEDESPHTPLIVRGMVDDAVDSPITPLFGDDEDDLMEYDEYARASHPADTAVPVRIEPPSYENFELPPVTILAKPEKNPMGAESRTQVMKNSRILEETLRSFRVEAEVVEVSVGPTVTRYDLAPGPGVKVNSIANLSNDLALSLAAQGIRIEAPIPGKSAVGIEIPNKEPQGVFLRDILESERFENFHSKLAFALGKDIAGNPVVADVADMPHLLIAGATGAGKSVCINTLIASILYKAKPDEVKLLMIDPKVVELSVYNGIPHLLIPVVTEPKKASGALNWAVQEMETRYKSFAETGCRDLKGYNAHLSEQDEPTLPQVVIIIDELADLMMTCKGEVEEAICRLAQKARAAGIHLIVATQRPSVDVITGLIKANIPSRLAFAVSSGTDSRTVLDMQGAEKLLGRGDMLFLPRGQNKPIRVQGGFISDKEVEQLVAFLKAQAPIAHTTEMIQQVTMPGKTKIEGELDEFFHEAVEFLLVKGKASTSMLQRQFRIGYNRASRLMEDLEIRGIVGPEDGVKPRKVTITREEYREIYGV